MYMYMNKRVRSDVPKSIYINVSSSFHHKFVIIVPANHNGWHKFDKIIFVACFHRHQKSSKGHVALSGEEINPLLRSGQYFWKRGHYDFHSAQISIKANRVVGRWNRVQRCRPAHFVDERMIKLPTTRLG